MVDPTQPSEPDVILVNSFDWFSVDAESLELTWDPTLLASVNATAELIDISLFGYREADDADSVLIVCSFNYHPQTKLREGNVFTGVCLLFCSGGSPM